MKKRLVALLLAALLVGGAGVSSVAYAAEPDYGVCIEADDKIVPFIILPKPGILPE